jgi:hypothetical protein
MVQDQLDGSEKAIFQSLDDIKAQNQQSEQALAQLLQEKERGQTFRETDQELLLTEMT